MNHSTYSLLENKLFPINSFLVFFLLYYFLRDSIGFVRSQMIGKPVLSLNQQQSLLQKKRMMLMQENTIHFSERSDKIFSSVWITERYCLFGTKDNKIGILDCINKRYYFLSLPPSRREFNGINAGIHTLSINPSSTFVASGGENPCDIVVFKTPDIIGRAILEGFEDWVFGSVWITDSIIAGCGRDGSVRIWSLYESSKRGKDFKNRNQKILKSKHCIHNSGDDSFFGLSVIPPKSTSFAQLGHIRGITYNNKQHDHLCTLSTERTLMLWDIEGSSSNLSFFPSYLSLSNNNLSKLSSNKGPLCPISSISLPNELSNLVALDTCTTSGNIAVGTYSHLLLIDPRSPSSPSSSENAKQNWIHTMIGCPGKGIRSFASDDLLLYCGIGDGKIVAFDERNQQYISIDKNILSSHQSSTSFPSSPAVDLLFSSSSSNISSPSSGSSSSSSSHQNTFLSWAPASSFRTVLTRQNTPGELYLDDIDFSYLHSPPQIQNEREREEERNALIDRREARSPDHFNEENDNRDNRHEDNNEEEVDDEDNEDDEEEDDSLVDFDDDEVSELNDFLFTENESNSDELSQNPIEMLQAQLTEAVNNRYNQSPPLPHNDNNNSSSYNHSTHSLTSDNTYTPQVPNAPALHHRHLVQQRIHNPTPQRENTIINADQGEFLTQLMLGMAPKEIPFSLYTLSFNPSKSVLFAGGGPYAVGLKGYYASLWK